MAKTATIRSRRWLTERFENDRLDMAYPTGLEKCELKCFSSPGLCMPWKIEFACRLEISSNDQHTSLQRETAVLANVEIAVTSRVASQTQQYSSAPCCLPSPCFTDDAYPISSVVGCFKTLTSQTCRLRTLAYGNIQGDIHASKKTVQFSISNREANDSISIEQARMPISSFGCRDGLLLERRFVHATSGARPLDCPSRG